MSENRPTSHASGAPPAEVSAAEYAAARGEALPGALPAEIEALAASHLRRETRGAAIMRSEQWHEPLGRLPREIVFGMNDGPISQLGCVAGVSGASDTTGPIVVAGLAATVSGVATPPQDGHAGVSSGRGHLARGVGGNGPLSLPYDWRRVARPSPGIATSYPIALAGYV